MTFKPAAAALPILLVLMPVAAFAGSIKDEVPDDVLATFCATQPIDSETEATLTLPDGTTLTGTVHCEAEDLIIGTDDQSTDEHEDQDDHHQGEDHDDDGGSDGGSDDEGDDDHGDGGHGGDDHGDDD